MTELHRKKKKRIVCRVNDIEHNYIQERANACNMTISDFMRNLLFEGQVVFIDTQSIVALTNEINKIGVNINQITKYINQSQDISLQQFKIIQEEFQKLSSLIYEYAWKGGE